MPKRTVEKKKAVIFIVEGSSDKRALEKIFQRIYKHRNIVFKFTAGDITSNENYDKTTVCDVIYSKVDAYMKDKKLRPKDIWQIVHIFDMDGAYVPESAAVEGSSDEFIYSTTQIMCKNKKRILDRNKKKCELMDYLLGLQTIKDISYTGFYMSSNLDHALYGEQNLEESLKGQYADAFYSEFIDREKLFVDFLKDEVANGVPNSFPDSWRYIKEDLHSLERHSNLHIYFEQNPYC